MVISENFIPKVNGLCMMQGSVQGDAKRLTDDDIISR